MTETNARPREGHGSHCGANASLVEKLASCAIPIRTGRRQRLALTGEEGEPIYLVVAGVVILDAILPADQRQIFACFYPGDVFRASMTPGLSGVNATAIASEGEVWRLRWPAFETLAKQDPEVALLLIKHFSEQASRLVLHITALGSLTGDQRVAYLLADLAARTGTTMSSGAVTFEMPFSRADMADYLALNPDTVSRIMSRLRTKGLLGRAAKGRLVCHDLAALRLESPLLAMLSGSAADRRL